MIAAQNSLPLEVRECRLVCARLAEGSLKFPISHSESLSLPGSPVIAICRSRSSLTLPMDSVTVQRECQGVPFGQAFTFLRKTRGPELADTPPSPMDMINKLTVPNRVVR